LKHSRTLMENLLEWVIPIGGRAAQEQQEE